MFFAGGGAALVALVLGVFVYSRMQQRSVGHAQVDAAKARQEAADAAERAIAARREQESPKRNTKSLAVEEKAVAIEKPKPGATREEVVKYIEYGIVKIETYSPWNEVISTGSGFVVGIENGSALVATNYHVMRIAYSKADVLFNKGIRFGVEGYVAVDPTLDLAIIRLNGMPPNTQSLSLSTDPAPKGNVYAIGHPLGYEFQTTGGEIKRNLRTSELEEGSRAFVQESMGTVTDHRWLKHTAPISPGNSGGPLLDLQGNVLGVNTWVNREENVGYASHVSHLEELLRRRTNKVYKLADYFSVPRERRGRGGEGPGLKIRLLQPPEFLAALAELDKLRWLPKTEGAFEKIRDVCATVSLVPDAELQVQALAKSLNAVKWDPAEHGLALNGRLAGRLDKPEGTLFLGTLEKAVKQGAFLRAFFQLDGAQKRVYIAFPESLGELKVGEKYLVVGFNSTETLVLEEGGKQLPAHVVESQLLIHLKSNSALIPPAAP